MADELIEMAEWALSELIPLTRELREDLERSYEPEKGWPSHIEKARDLGDYEQVLSDLRVRLGAGQA